MHSCTGFWKLTALTNGNCLSKFIEQYFITGCLQSTHPFRRNIICVSLYKLFVAYIWRETCGKILVWRGDFFLKLWTKSLLPMTIKRNMIFHFYEFISDCWSLCLKSNINQRHEKCYVSGKTFLKNVSVSWASTCLAQPIILRLGDPALNLLFSLHQRFNLDKGETLLLVTEHHRKTLMKLRAAFVRSSFCTTLNGILTVLSTFTERKEITRRKLKWSELFLWSYLFKFDFYGQL